MSKLTQEDFVEAQSVVVCPTVGDTVKVEYCVTLEIINNIYLCLHNIKFSILNVPSTF